MKSIEEITPDIWWMLGDCEVLAPRWRGRWPFWAWCALRKTPVLLTVKLIMAYLCFNTFRVQTLIQASKPTELKTSIGIQATLPPWTPANRCLHYRRFALLCSGVLSERLNLGLTRLNWRFSLLCVLINRKSIANSIVNHTCVFLGVLLHLYWYLSYPFVSATLNYHLCPL